MAIQCTDIFFFVKERKETTEKKMKKRIAANWQTSTRTSRFGKIMLPLKHDYGIEIVLSMRLLRTRNFIPDTEGCMPGSSLFSRQYRDQRKQRCVVVNGDSFA